jgi:hypothetical protein
MKKYVIVLLIFLLTACSPISLMPTMTPTNTQVAPTATNTLTPAPTSTPTPTPTLTLIPISSDEKELIIQAYKVMLFIQIDSNMLDQTATKIKAGELTGLNSFVALITLAAMVNAVDEAIPQTKVPDIISPFWEQALPVQSATKDLVSRWVNKEIDSTVVLEEVAPLLEKIEKTMVNLDQELEFNYGFDAQEMKKARQDAIDSMNEIFATATPQP